MFGQVTGVLSLGRVLRTYSNLAAPLIAGGGLHPVVALFTTGTSVRLPLIMLMLYKQRAIDCYEL